MVDENRVHGSELRQSLGDSLAVTLIDPVSVFAVGLEVGEIQ